MMENCELLIGLDVGTSSSKLSVYNETGETIFEGFERYPTYYPRPGWAEQSPQDWILTVKRLLQRMAAELGDSCQDISAMGLSVHCPSLVLASRDGQSLHERAPIWSDERSAGQAGELLKRAGPKFAGLGLPGASFPAKLAWFIEEMPEVCEKAAYAVGAKGYLLHWLTGEFGSEPSSEPGNEPAWKEVMDAAGWPLEKLAPVFQPTESAGRLLKVVCEETGLPKRIPVVVGLNDGGCSTLSSGAISPGDATIELATNGVVYLVSRHKIPAETCIERSFFCWPYLQPTWIVGGQTKCGASAYRWAAELFSGAEPLEIDDFIGKAEGSPTGSNGLFFYPYLRGRGTPNDNPQALSSITGLSMRTTQADLYRSILEGVAYSIREIIDYLGKTDFPIQKVYLTGGGGQNEFNRQLLADVTGLPMSCSQAKATLGAALLAGVGTGRFGSVSEALQAISVENPRVEPNPGAHALYSELFERYCNQRDRMFL